MKNSSALALLCAAQVAACAGPTAVGDGPGVSVAIAPLELPRVTDAAWRVTVTTTTDTVWTHDLTSRAYGDGAGGLTYVGPCDADAGVNTVTVELLGLYQGVDGATPVLPAGYSNPGPVSRDVTCVVGQDTSVSFDVTLARAATQGFFDVAVSFDDIFCSAKLS